MRPSSTCPTYSYTRGIDVRNQFVAFGENVFLDFFNCLVGVLGVVDVSRRRTKNKIAPKCCLDKNTFSEWTRAREQRVLCEVTWSSARTVRPAGAHEGSRIRIWRLTLVAVQQHVITQARLDLKRVVANHVGNFVRART